MRRRWRLATYDEVKDVSGRLRESDARECFIRRGVPAHQYIPQNYHPGTTWVLYNAAGENAALCGCEPVGKQQGLIWMVATPTLLNHQLEFLRGSKEWIDMVSRPFIAVGNDVHAANEVHLKWLKWCGFTFLREKEINGEKFIDFIKVTKQCV